MASVTTDDLLVRTKSGDLRGVTGGNCLRRLSDSGNSTSALASSLRLATGSKTEASVTPKSHKVVR